MRVERENFSLSGDLPLPLALRRAQEKEGERIERILSFCSFFLEHGIPRDIISTLIPGLLTVSGLPGETKILIEGLLNLKEEKIPPAQRQEEVRRKILEHLKSK